MKASTLPMAGIVVSAALSAWAILLWPELFLFSKVVQYPVWAGIFPDPMIPAWCLAFGALGPTWLEPLRRAGVRIALDSLLGPLVGAVAHDMGLGFSFIAVLYQFAWAFIFCFLGPNAAHANSYALPSLEIGEGRPKFIQAERLCGTA